MKRLVPILAAGALFAGACTQSGTVVGITPETALEVDPLEFLGDVRCGTSAGDLQEYVATVFDVSDLSPLHAGVEDVALPSATPTPCFQTVLFQRIVPGRQYAAQVDGYDRPVCASDVTTPCIRPRAPGSRVMVDADGAYVAPRWTTSCSYRWSAPEPTASASDAGTPLVEAGVAPAQTSNGVTVGDRPDAAQLVYAACRGAKYPDGGPYPWLHGPVCAVEFNTIPFSGCDDLHEP